MLQSPYVLQQQERVEGSRSTAAGKRPKLSLASLIGQAILSCPDHKARLSQIYEWISGQYPEYYKLNYGGWQNSIRHNLTINKAFARIPKQPGDVPGKGSYWTIHPDHLQEFKDGIFTGKIRSSEYRSQPKQNKKRQSAPDLPSLTQSEYGSFYGRQSLYSTVEYAQSTPSLLDRQQSISPVYHTAASTTEEGYGYQGPPPQPARYRTHTPPGQYSYVPTTGHQAYCQCAYCMTLPSLSGEMSSMFEHEPTLHLGGMYYQTGMGEQEHVASAVGGYFEQQGYGHSFIGENHE